jgi:hypothetical protein
MIFATSAKPIRYVGRDFEGPTLCSYALNQSINENILQAMPISREKTRKTWPM